MSDEDDDDDDGSCHSNEASTIQDDDGFEPEQESDNESEDGTPGKGKATRCSGDLRFCGTGGRMSDKTGVITLSWVVIIDPWSYGEALPP